MAFTPVINVLQVELRQRLFLQQVENTLYWLYGGAPTTSDANTLAAAVAGWWTAEMSPLLSQDLELHEVYVTDISSESGFTVSYTTGLPDAGGVPTAALPGNVAVSCTFRTINRGRSFRGRNYVAGIPEASVIGNTIDSGLVSGIGDAYTALIGLAGIASADWVVVSRYENGESRGFGIATPVVSALVVDNLVDSMRRRLTGRGT